MLSFYCIPSRQLPPLSSTWAVPMRPPGTQQSDLLCQRSQSCMKFVHHSGFCAGHKGFCSAGKAAKRKSTDGEPPSPNSHKRGTQNKRQPKASPMEGGGALPPPVHTQLVFPGPMPRAHLVVWAAPRLAAIAPCLPTCSLACSVLRSCTSPGCWIG
jgi:hypothetical protein